MGNARNDDDRNESSVLRRALESGARLTGSAGGAAVGLVVAGPAGAVAGAVAGQWATEELIAAGLEITQRVLAPRAEARIGAVFRLADEEVSVRLMAGEVPRDDLRAEVTPGRNQAEELIEATLVAASESFEERKLPYISHLLAAILFEPDLTHAQAHQLIATARSLTYRQLLLLAVFAARQPHSGDSLDFRGEGHEQENADEHELMSVRVDMLDLFRRGLIRVSERTASPSYDPWLGTSHDRQRLPWPALPREMSPRDTWASNTGERLARMMRLDLTPSEDREALVMNHIGRDRRRQA
jgi:hypothetical protein